MAGIIMVNHCIHIFFFKLFYGGSKLTMIGDICTVSRAD